MKVRPDAKTGSVIVAIPAREAMHLASELVRAALASGAEIEQEDRQEPTPDVSTEREG
ncbi:MAG: hypothetical protein OEU68_07335 [Nitrospira sp.]|nr:hypothetical protein [Nitrospira sp.]MDH4245032.1 hypothetical protein [Nitrospira sp.]MDH4355963.1 hypothetical protein [Nitrospira sp.]MDH5319363.1 hypothetical protein [Nitrospira sp.]